LVTRYVLPPSDAGRWVDGLASRAGVAVAARLGGAVGHDSNGRELASLVVSTLQELQERLRRLCAADRVLAVGDEERHAGDAVPRGLLFVGSHRVGMGVPVEDRLHLRGWQADLGGQAHEGGRVSDRETFGEDRTTRTQRTYVLVPHTESPTCTCVDR